MPYQEQIIPEDPAISRKVLEMLTVAAPMNECELRNLMFTAQLPNKGPFVIRYPRGNGVITDWQKPFAELQIGKGEKLKEIATQSRLDMEKLFDGKVFLEVWVKVRSGWADSPQMLKSLGYE